MSRPLILLIEPHEEHLGRGRDFLLADCSATFDVVTTRSLEEARAKLDAAAEKQQPVALLLVRHILDEAKLRDLLRRAKDVSKGVKVILYADELNPPFAGDAKRAGLVDFSIAEPWETPETSLEPIVRDALRAWEAQPATT
ncbi:MAG TPA: hypothetical protein VHK90_00460, partial [Thermoanaerobaculia bacterium]|nr:hypothetical protein [Thermoanaerobaculia bacterium]